MSVLPSGTCLQHVTGLHFHASKLRPHLAVHGGNAGVKQMAWPLDLRVDDRETILLPLDAA
eukprot:CAMPEP_0203953654 /NCGR_PEP_ID=MMETSP0359-20131031/86963_1 /ASSEMBLY_ACC=CAM_ASM_000338 /TAXON_ID=268821 /ORGANISM="Scrippsiella Hangoei, Strain SHTV-5" /LENGTH=60 /DNA_ID=CAMNT_0050887037 /DNA_START=122 /DNA_END=300 /DNA_ORIENTATION=+